MTLVAALLAFAALQSQKAPSLAEVRAAIWSDVELNATIGNYNDAVSWDWVYGEGRDHPPTLTIVGLQCGQAATYHCEFDLTRQADPAAPVADKTQVERLRCRASFKWSSEDRRWAVMHLPPPKGRGHTRTSMQCDRTTT